MAFKFEYLGRKASVHVNSLLPRLVSKQGMTIGKHIFIAGGQKTVSAYLLAHEFGHVVQWSRLGPLGFLSKYLGELIRKGYTAHSMEEEAHACGLAHQFGMAKIAQYIRGGV